ncbi:hypothetical protein M569_00909, partial [Genlisea aurea]
LKAAKRVVLVRHGQSTWNAEGRIQGSSDFSVLTDKGESQAETSRQMLLDDSFDVCFSSPLIRSKRTAEIIWGSRKGEIITDSNLREIDLYSFQGLLKNEGKAMYGAAYRQWQIDAPNFNIDGHYPVRELWTRARYCWSRILVHESRSVLVVAHNAANQALVATAIGLGTEYFRVLLQSNCGVSVLDFTPNPNGGSPEVFLNRLNQTPSSPLAGGGSGGRKTSSRIILASHGFSSEVKKKEKREWFCSSSSALNMLGVIQAQKISELLLDLKVRTVISSTTAASVETAKTISKVQEAADCLGADCVPRYVETKHVSDLDVVNILNLNETAWKRGSLKGVYLDETMINEFWDRSGAAWKCLLHELSSKELLLQKESGEGENVVVAVGHSYLHMALLGHCLNLGKERLGSFHLDAGSVSVVDFPDGPGRPGVVRCINYTAHLGRWSIPITR